MKYLIFSLLLIHSFDLLAKENDWILRAKIDSMRSSDQVWVNNQGDFYWATSYFYEAMPCSTKLKKNEINELSTLIQSLPSKPYEREFNNQCKDGLRFFILSSTEQADGTFIMVGKEFPALLNCRKNPIDKSWDELSAKLYNLTKEKFESCRDKTWR